MRSLNERITSQDRGPMVDLDIPAEPLGAADSLRSPLTVGR